MVTGRSESTEAKRAVVVGAGRLSRAIADSYESDRGGGSVLGFAVPTDADIPTGGVLDGRPVAALDEAMRLWRRDADLVLVGGPCAASRWTPGWRKAAFHALIKRGLPVGGFVHREAWVLPGAQIAPSAIVLDGAYIEPLSRIGRNAVLEGNSFVTQNARVGAHSHLETSALIAGLVEIHADVVIGTNAILRSGVTLGRGARVGPGAVVQRDLHPFESVSVRPTPAAPPHPSAS